MLNVRLDKDTEKKLRDYAEQNATSKSSIVKEALAMYFSKTNQKQTSFDLGADLFGPASSGQSDLSKTYKSKLKKKINEKHAH